jgi:hypothetical protein
MPKLGRPFVYQEGDKRPVTISLRVPADVYERLKRYASEHRQSVTELLLEGLQWRLEQGADPREQSLNDIQYYYNNTVIQQLQEMVDAAVQQALAKERDMLRPAAALAEVLADAAAFLEDEDDEAMPAPEAPAPPAPELSYNDNTVLQKSVPRGSTPPRQYKLTSQQAAALRAKREQGALIQALTEAYGISRASVYHYLK